MNETPLCLLLEMRSGWAFTLFGTIFLEEMAQNQAVVLYSDNVSHLSPFHTEIPENTRVMCSGICSRIVRFAAFTLPVIFRNMCVHSHTTRKDTWPFMWRV